MELKIGSDIFQLSHSLRVAYALQKEHGNKPYMQILETIADMPIEKQISLLYISHKVAEPGSPVTQKEFMDMVLDELGLHQIMDIISELVNSMMYKGLTEEQIEAVKAKTEGKTTAQ